jgi:hypothetical protein
LLVCKGVYDMWGQGDMWAWVEWEMDSTTSCILVRQRHRTVRQCSTMPEQTDWSCRGFDGQSTGGDGHSVSARVG